MANILIFIAIMISAGVGEIKGQTTPEASNFYIPKQSLESVFDGSNDGEQLVIKELENLNLESGLRQNKDDEEFNNFYGKWWKPLDPYNMELNHYVVKSIHKKPVEEYTILSMKAKDDAYYFRSRKYQGYKVLALPLEDENYFACFILPANFYYFKQQFKQSDFQVVLDSMYRLPNISYSIPYLNAPIPLYGDPNGKLVHLLITNSEISITIREKAPPPPDVNQLGYRAKVDDMENNIDLNGPFLFIIMHRLEHIEYYFNIVVPEPVYTEEEKEKEKEKKKKKKKEK